MLKFTLDVLKKRKGLVLNLFTCVYCLEFLFLLERELDKVEAFYRKKMETIEKRLFSLQRYISSKAFNPFVPQTQKDHTLSNSVCEYHDDDFSTVDPDSLLLEHIEECRIWLLKLCQYAELNVDGFRKALKKYDKQRGQKTDLLSSYYTSKVLRTSFAQYKSVHVRLCLELDSVTDCVLKRFSSLAEGGESNNGYQILKEVRRIWNGIYNLQVRAILERDDAEKLVEIAKNLDLGKVNTEQSPQFELSWKPSAGTDEKTINLLDREHSLLLRHLLDGICTHLSLGCLQLLITAGLNVRQTEGRLNISLIANIINAVKNLDQEKRPDAVSVATSMIQVLLDQQATQFWTDSRGRNIFHHIAISGSDFFLDLLLTHLEKPVFLDFDNDGCAPLFYSIQSGRVQITKSLMDQHDRFQQKYLLIAPSVPVFGEDSGKGSIEPLILACKLGHHDLAKMMIDRRLDLDVIDSDGETALHHCAKRDFLSIMKLLLENGADPERRDKYKQWTPLFLAACSGCFDCAKTLIDYGANCDAVDVEGWTPFEHAMLRGHSQVALNIKPSKPMLHPSPSPAPSTLESSDAPQEYGHVFLGEEVRMLLNLGHRSGPRSLKPPIEVVDRPVMGPLDLQLKIYPSNSALGEEVHFTVPVREEIDSISFLLANGLQRYFSPWDEIRFDLIKAEPSGSTLVVGRGSVILRQFITEEGRPESNRSNQFVVPVLESSSLELMALISFEVLIACPFQHPKMLERQRIYWKSVTSKVIGHRGLGANIGLPHPQIGENTVLSFVMAASLGAEYVEFDVQLTKDRVPVLYHDFIVSETGLDVSVSGLTLKQFLELRKRHSATNSHNLRFSTTDDIGTVAKAGRSASIAGMDLADRAQLSKRVIEAPFSTLREAFRKVPAEIGFNIEIKYPTKDEYVHVGLQFVFEANEYCDEILKVVFEESQDRPVIFSSFHPDICLLLSLKQPNFPVFFLTESGMSQLPSEPRANSLQQALKFSASANLLGIVSHSTPLVEAPRLIQLVKQNGLLLFTYGPRNNEVEAVRLQVAHGVDAVIVDSVARIRKGLVGQDRGTP